MEKIIKIALVLVAIAVGVFGVMWVLDFGTLDTLKEPFLKTIYVLGVLLVIAVIVRLISTKKNGGGDGDKVT